MPRQTKNEKLAQARSIAGAVAKHFDSESVPVAGMRYGVTEMKSLFESHIDAMRKVDATHAAYAQAVREEAALAKKAKLVAAQLKLLVLLKYGPNLAILGDFDWSPPRKTGPKTAKGKLAGVEKRRAKSAAKRAAVEAVEGTRRRRR